MNPRNPLIVAAIIFYLGFSLIAAFVAFHVGGLILMFFIFLLFAFGVWLAFRPRYELIDEMEVGVIFHRFNNSFCRLHPETEPEPRHGCTEYKIPLWIPFGLWWLQRHDPHYVRLKWYEKPPVRVTKKSQSTNGILEDIRTADGIPVKIPWKVSFTVNMYAITDDLKHKMARTLPENADKVVKGKVERAIKHLVETRKVKELYEDRVIQKLEVEIAQNTYAQLAEEINGADESSGQSENNAPSKDDKKFIFNLGFNELKAKDVSLGPIEMPFEIEKALEAAHQRKIHTEMVSAAMERLQEAVGKFTHQDMKRLEKLEKLRILDDKDIESIHLAKVFVGK